MPSSTPNAKSASPACIVVGGRGFAGSAMVAEACARGYAVTVIDRQNYAQHMGTKCDLLINANGNSRKFLAAADPRTDFDLSVRSVKHTLQDFPAACYVYLSSVDVYPYTQTPTAENAEDAVLDIARMSHYGFHKYIAEQMVRHDNPDWIIFRMGGLVGPGMWKSSIFDLLNHQPLRVHPDSEYQYLNTGVAAAIVLDLVARGIRREIFNIMGEGVIALRTVAGMIPGCDLSATPDDLPRERYEINIAKLKQHATLPPTEATMRAFIRDMLVKNT